MGATDESIPKKSFSNFIKSQTSLHTSFILANHASSDEQQEAKSGVWNPIANPDFVKLAEG
jgi:hypothetical protein